MRTLPVFVYDAHYKQIIKIKKKIGVLKRQVERGGSVGDGGGDGELKNRSRRR